MSEFIDFEQCYSFLRKHVKHRIVYVMVFEVWGANKSKNLLLLVIQYRQSGKL